MTAVSVPFDGAAVQMPATGLAAHGPPCPASDAPTGCSPIVPALGSLTCDVSSLSTHTAAPPGVVNVGAVAPSAVSTASVGKFEKIVMTSAVGLQYHPTGWLAPLPVCASSRTTPAVAVTSVASRTLI